MLRLLLTPRWLAATVFAIVAVVVCAWLGTWQWDRAHRPPRPVAVEDERVIPFGDVAAQPADLAFPSGLLVRASGTYTGDTFVAPGVTASGATQRWSAAPLAADAVPEKIAVVRGAATPRPSAPTSDAVVVTGRLQPPMPSGGLSAAELRGRGLDPRGYLVVVAQQPPDARPATPVASPAPLRPSPLRWQNSVYAVQWFLFGGFVAFAWMRFFRDDLRDARDGEDRPVE